MLIKKKTFLLARLGTSQIVTVVVIAFLGQIQVFSLSVCYWQLNEEEKQFLFTDTSKAK